MPDGDAGWLALASTIDDTVLMMQREKYFLCQKAAEM